MNAETVDRIADQIRAEGVKHRPVLIAIDGFGGSGKSTIAVRLKDALADAYVVSIDDFIVKEKLLEKSADELLFDRVRLERQVLIPAIDGLPVAYQRLEWAENKLGDPISVPMTDYLIVEGISSCHPDIAKYYDYTVWVDAPIEVARERGRQRDAGNENEQHWDLWAANDLAYQNKYHPERQAGFVINNS